MPTKTTKTGVEYEVTGKHLIWRPLDENDNRDGELEPIRLPMRIKLKTIRVVTGELDAAAMFAMLEALIPGQADALDEMDLNDFMEMFTVWQDEYSNLTGVSLGE